MSTLMFSALYDYEPSVDMLFCCLALYVLYVEMYPCFPCTQPSIETRLKAQRVRQAACQSIPHC